jgi:hypothetical protein
MALIVKDLTITQLMEPWLEAAAQENFLPRIVIAMRNPEEVISSWIESMDYLGDSPPKTAARTIDEFVAEMEPDGGAELQELSTCLC